MEEETEALRDSMIRPKSRSQLVTESGVTSVSCLHSSCSYPDHQTLLPFICFVSILSRQTRLPVSPLCLSWKFQTSPFPGPEDPFPNPVFSNLLFKFRFPQKGGLFENPLDLALLLPPSSPSTLYPSAQQLLVGPLFWYFWFRRPVYFPCVPLLSSNLGGSHWALVTVWALDPLPSAAHTSHSSLYISPPTWGPDSYNHCLSSPSP